MMTSKPMFGLTILSILLLPSTSLGHHSMSSYDLENEVLIEGTVTRVQWVNPHVYIYVEAATPGAAPAVWAVEGLNPSSMRRLGWRRDTLEVGDTLAISGNPGKTPGSYSIYPRIMQQGEQTLFDESQFYAGILSAREQADTPADSLAGVWKTRLTPPVIVPIFGDLHDLTEKGEAAYADFDELTMNPGTDCGQMNAPISMHMGDAKLVSLEAERMIIQGDYDGSRRTIYLGMDSHDGAQESEQGHSIGRWEDNTLVVDTTHFSPNRYGNGMGVPSGTGKHLIERFRLSDDGYRLHYEIELTDPEYLASPLVSSTEWDFSPDLEFEVEECDLESARRFQSN